MHFLNYFRLFGAEVRLIAFFAARVARVLRLGALLFTGLRIAI